MKKVLIITIIALVIILVVIFLIPSNKISKIVLIKKSSIFGLGSKNVIIKDTKEQNKPVKKQSI